MALRVKKFGQMGDDEDEEMDVEALRLAALQSLKKPTMKTETVPANSVGPVACPSNVNRNIRGRGINLGRGRGRELCPLGRGRGRGRGMGVGIHRNYPNSNNSFQNFHGGNNNGFYPNRPPASSNLITIVPTVPDQGDPPPNSQFKGPCQSSGNKVPNDVPMDTKQEKVPAKFSRLDEDSNSEESDDEFSKDTKSRSGDTSGEDQDHCDVESSNESGDDEDVVNLQPEDEGENSLERLMKELEDEINEVPGDKKSVVPPNEQKSEKKIKKEKDKRKKEKTPLESASEVEKPVDRATSSKIDSVPEPSNLKSKSSRSPSPRRAQALKSRSRTPPVQSSSGRQLSPQEGNSASGPWSPRKCISPRRALSPQGIHSLPRGTASNRTLSPEEHRSPSRSYATHSRSPNVSPLARRTRSRSRSPYRSPRRSPTRYPLRLSPPGRLPHLRSRSRSPRRFRSKSRSPIRGGYLRRSRSPRSPSRTLRRSPSPSRRQTPLIRARSRSPGGRPYPLRHSRSLSPRSFKAIRSFSPKGRRSPSPYISKVSPRKRSVSPRRSPAWSGPYLPRRNSRSPQPYNEPYPVRRSRSPATRRYSPLRSYRSPSPGSRATLRRRSPRPVSPSRYSPLKSSRRSMSPGRVRERLSPGRMRDWPPSPVRLRPSPSRARQPSPGRVRERLSPPPRVRDRPVSPVRVRDRPLSPPRGRDRAPSPGRPRERPASPSRARERLTPPTRARERPLSPGRTRDRISPRDRPVSPTRTRERMPSPVRPRERVSSPPSAVPTRHIQRPVYQRLHQISRMSSPRKHSPPNQITHKSLPSPRQERGRSRSESISLSPSPEPQPAHRPLEERSRHRTHPLKDCLTDSKLSRSDLRSILPKRRNAPNEESKDDATPVEHSKREKREKKKSKKEKRSKKGGTSRDVDPILEARRRKFEAGAVVEVTGKKIRLRTNTSELPDTEKSDHHDEWFDAEKEKEREMKEATEVDESILDKELMGGVDLLWSDEEEDVNESVSDSVHFKRTFNLASDTKAGKENIPEEGPKHTFEEPSSTTSSPPANQLSDDAKSSDLEDYEEFCESEKTPHEDTLPKTNKELKEFILSQAKRKSSAHPSPNSSDVETVKTKSRGAEDLKGCDDLRAELSRKRAERQTKANTSTDTDTIPRRLLQSALQSVGVRPSLSSVSRKRQRSPCEEEIDKQDSERRRVLVLRRAMELKAPAINIIIPKVESPNERSSKVPIHMRLGVGTSSRGDDECPSPSKVKLKRNISLGRKNQV